MIPTALRAEVWQLATQVIVGLRVTYKPPTPGLIWPNNIPLWICTLSFTIRGNSRENGMPQFEPHNYPTTQPPHSSFPARHATRCSRSCARNHLSRGETAEESNCFQALVETTAWANGWTTEVWLLVYWFSRLLALHDSVLINGQSPFIMDMNFTSALPLFLSLLVIGNQVLLRISPTDLIEMPAASILIK